jgi:hypothetical protein
MPDERRIDAGPVLAALGGLLLLVSLFLDWYETDVSGERASAWNVFEVLDLVLAASALAALTVFVGLFARTLPLAPRSLLPVGTIAFVVAGSQLLNPPPVVGEDASVEAGAWLALAGSALMLAGAIMSFARVSLAVAPREDLPAPAPGSGASAPGGAPPPAGPAAGAPGAVAGPPVDEPAPGPDPREVEQRAQAEAAASEPAVQDELYPEVERSRPIGSDDPEPWTAAPEADTSPLEEERGPGS